MFEGVKRNVEAKIGGSKDWVPVSGVAGASAGLASTMVVYPFNTLMDRLLLEVKETHPRKVDSRLCFIMWSGVGLVKKVLQLPHLICSQISTLHYGEL